MAGKDQEEARRLIVPWTAPQNNTCWLPRFRPRARMSPNQTPEPRECLSKKRIRGRRLEYIMGRECAHESCSRCSWRAWRVLRVRSFPHDAQPLTPPWLARARSFSRPDAAFHVAAGHQKKPCCVGGDDGATAARPSSSAGWQVHGRAAAASSGLGEAEG